MHCLYIVKVIVIVRIVIVSIVIVMYCHCFHCYCTYCYCALLLYPLFLYPLFIVIVDLEYCISLLQYCSSGDSQMQLVAHCAQANFPLLELAVHHLVLGAGGGAQDLDPGYWTDEL